MANTGDFNKKKGISVFVAEGVPEADLGAVLGNLPEDILVTGCYATVTTVSGTATATVDLTVGGTVLANEVVATALGSTGSATPLHLPAGGTVVLEAGAVAPATGSLVASVAVTYIELRKATGELTNV